MIGKKINQLATELAPVSTDLTIIGDPISGVSKKITLAQLGAIFSGAVSFYTNLAGFPATGDINVIYCAKDTQKLYLWSGSAYVEVFPSQALLDTYQLRSEKGVSNGYASLDSSGKVPISQLPSSIMEYKGTWNAATNTPTLANGTGDTGDVYICNVAGTVNFGAGAITFAVGDYVIYSGSIWQRSSGAVGTVTSVAASITGNAIGITGSPVTTSGTLALAFAGTSAQYINGAGNLTTFPTLTGYVPYTGATANVDLGTHTLLAKDLVINHSSGSGVAASITKGGNGEALTVVKSSGSGNAASITGGVTLLDELHLNTDLADTYIASASNWNAAYNDKINSAAVTGTTTKTLTLTQQDGGTITASWTDDNTDAVTSVFGRTGAVVAVSGDYNTSQVTENTNLYFTNARAIASTLTGYTSGAGTISATDTILSAIQKLNGNIGALTTGVSSVNGLTGAVTLTTSNIAEGTNLYYTEARVSANTDVAANTAARHNAVTIGTANGLSLSTQVLSLALASGSTTGALSSTDWTTFNNKQSALTNPVTGTGTTNYLPKFTGTSTIGDSLVFDNGTRVGINTASISNTTLTIYDGTGNGDILKVDTNGTKADIWLNNSTTTNGAVRIRSESNSLKFITGSNERLFLDASGNLGLGVTPSAWGVYKAYQVGWGSIASYDGADTAIFSNTYFDGGTWRYIGTGYASQYRQLNSVHSWHTAPSGTAGNAISFTQAMTLNASGNLSIGNTNDTYKLDVSGTGRFTGQVTIKSGNGNQLLLDNAGERFTQMYFFNNNTYKSAIWWDNDTSKFEFYTGVTALSIASTGAATFSSSVTATDLILGNGSNLSWGGAYGAGIPTIVGYNAGSGGALYFYPNGSTSSEKMRLFASGNLSIGNTNDTYKLDVLGPDGSVGTIRWANAGGRKSGFLYSDSAGVAIYDTNLNDAGIYIAGNTQMDFRVNGSQRMFINSSGNVGIGTTSPAEKLSLFGGTSTTFGLSLEPSGWNGAKHRFSVPVSGDTSMLSFNYNGSSVDSSSYATSAIYLTQGVLAFSTGTTNTAPSERLRITSGGNVGIGTASPNNIFTIYAASSAIYTQWIQSGTGTTSTDGLRIGLDASSNGIIDLNEGTALITNVNGSERMRITSGGKIGIGTSSPSYYGLDFTNQFTVSSAATSQYANITAAGGAGAGGGIDFGNQTVRHAGVYSLDGSHLGFYTNGSNSGSGLSERMRITSGGNVGIGVTNPTEKLEVNGSIKTSAPFLGTAKPWKLGAVYTGTCVPTSWGEFASWATGTVIEVEIDGSTYRIPVVVDNYC